MSGWGADLLCSSSIIVSTSWLVVHSSWFTPLQDLNFCPELAVSASQVSTEFAMPQIKTLWDCDLHRGWIWLLQARRWPDPLGHELLRVSLPRIQPYQMSLPQFWFLRSPLYPCGQVRSTIILPSSVLPACTRCCRKHWPLPCGATSLRYRERRWAS